MRRLILCVALFLPFCLFIQDRYYGLEDQALARLSRPAAVEAPQAQRVVISGVDLLRQQFLGAMTFAPSAGIPASIPWACLYKSQTEGLQYVLENHPLLFLQMALDRYDAEVEGYSCVLRKRERIGKLHNTERVQCHFLEKPFSVYMKWLEGARLCGACSFVEGKNDGNMWCRGAGLVAFAVVQRPLDGSDAKASSRYPINEFGIRWGTQRGLKSLQDAQKGNLQMRYVGEVEVPEAGGARCYQFHFKYDPPDEFGLVDLTIGFDVKNWLQVASVLKDGDGNLIAEYFFRDIVLNPKLPPTQFDRGAI